MGNRKQNLFFFFFFNLQIAIGAIWIVTNVQGFVKVQSGGSTIVRIGWAILLFSYALGAFVKYPERSNQKSNRLIINKGKLEKKNNLILNQIEFQHTRSSRNPTSKLGWLRPLEGMILQDLLPILAIQPQAQRKTGTPKKSTRFSFF